jgi:hypothetical protein
VNVQIVHDDGALRLGVLRNLVIGVWREAPTVEQLRTVDDRARLASKDGPIGYINAILAGSGNFPPEVRAEVTRQARDASLPRAGVAHLVLLPGWKGPAARAFVRAAITLAHAPAPNRVFRDAEHCADWLADRMPGEWSSSAILSAYLSCEAVVQ